MKRRRLLISLFCLAAVASPAAQASYKVYALDQIVRSIGRQKSLISEKAIQIEQNKMARRMQLRAPAWNVLTINDANKTYFESKADNRSGLIMQRIQLFEGNNYDKVKWTPVEEATIGGIKACRYVDGIYAKNWKLRTHGFDMTEAEMRENGFWAAKDDLVPPAAANALARINGVPQIGKVPLRCIHCTSNVKKKITVLDTFSCAPAAVNITALNVPADYTKSLSEFDGSVKGQGMMDAFFPLEEKHK